MTDIRDGSQVGDIKLSPILRNGYVKANGALLTSARTNYPRLVAFIEENPLQKSYVYDRESDTITLPNYQADSPVGTVISYMGNTVPTGYLSCDGTVYNITDYPELAEYTNNQFGSYNYFGGNGTTTFAVPDLRGEFLRGTGTNSHTNQGSGANAGVHQNGTEIPSGYMTSNNNGLYLTGGIANTMRNNDSIIPTGHPRTSVFNPAKLENDLYLGAVGRFTSRPTNTSVLYCIKCTSYNLIPQIKY